jgi:iron complex outermembrane receptor protein
MRVLVLLVSLTASFCSFGQSVVRGIVKDAYDDSGIPGTSVYIPDLKKGTVTDSDGKFVLENLPRGKFLFQFKSLSYASVVKTVDVGLSDEIVEIRLSNSVVELSEIVISGVSHSTELKKNPIPISTIGKDALNANASRNIIENIANEAGVYHVSTGVALAKPVIRGLGYNRIITIFDGVRQEGQQWGDEHGIEIDEFSVDRVEIIKGAGSLLYGSDGLGGVINFLPANPVAMGTVETGLISNYQSNNGLWANSIMNAGNKNGFYWLGRATHKAARAYQNGYDGYVFNSGFREQDFGLTAGLNRSWGYTQISYSSFQQKVGLVEGDRDAGGNFLRMANVNGEEEAIAVSDKEMRKYTLYLPNQHIDHQKLSSTTSLYYREAKFQLNVGYQQNERREFGSVLAPDDADLFFDLKSFTYNLTAYLPPLNNWDFSISTSGMSQENGNKGREFLIPEYALFEWGTVLFAKRSFDKLDVAGGLRFDHRGIKTEALFLDPSGVPTGDVSQNKKFSEARLAYRNISASAGFTYQFSDLMAIKFNTSRGFRAPNIAELTSNGMHEGSLRYEIGNMGLQPETSIQADVGLSYNAPHVSAEFSLYQNNIDQYIYAKKLLNSQGNDSIPDPGNAAPAYIFTQGKARLMGGEFSIDLHPHPLDWLHFENAVSIVYARNRSVTADSARYLPFTPAPRLQSEIRISSGSWKTFSNLFLSIQYEHYLKQDRVLLENGTETPTPAYTLWNAGLGFDVLRKEKSLFSFYFTAENILDVAYQNNLSRLKYAPVNPATGRRGVFNMGRNFSFKVLVPLVWVEAGRKI